MSHRCPLCKKVFPFKIELNIHQRIDHGETKDDQPQTQNQGQTKISNGNSSKQPTASSSTNSRFSHPAERLNCKWNFEKTGVVGSTWASTSLSSPNTGAGALFAAIPKPPSPEKFKLTSMSGAVTPMHVVIKIEPAESTKAVNTELHFREAVLPLELHHTGSSDEAMLCDNDNLTKDSSYSSEIISLNESENDDDKGVPLIVSARSLLPLETDKVITGNATEIPRRKNRRKSTPCRANERKKFSLCRESGGLDSFYFDRGCSDFDAVDRPGSLTCIACNKTMRNHAKLVLHLRKYHSRAHGVSKPIPEIVYGKPSVLNRWSCKKCGKRFECHANLWKHRIQTCGLLHYSRNWKRKNIGLQRSVLNTDTGTPDMHQLLLRLTENAARTKQTTSPLKNGIAPINDLSLRKCRWQYCKRVFTHRTQLISHARECHDIFMCLLCDTVMFSCAQLEAHSLSRHPKCEKLFANNQHSMELLNNKNFMEAEANRVDFQPNTSGSSGPLIKEKHSVEESIAFGVKEAQGRSEPQSRRSDSVYLKDTFERGVGVRPRVIIKKINVSASTRNNRKTNQKLVCDLCSCSFTKSRLYFKHRNECRGSPTFMAASVFSNDLNTAHNSVLRDIKPPRNENGNVDSSAETCSVNSVKTEAVDKPKKSFQKAYKCNDCSQEFRNNNSLKLHVDEASCRNKSYLYDCQHCQQKFSRKASLRNHLKSQHKRSLSGEEDSDEKGESSNDRCRCTICLKMYASARGLKAHIDKQHPVSNKNNMPKLDHYPPVEPTSDSLLHLRINQAEQRVSVSKSPAPGVLSAGRFKFRKRPSSHVMTPEKPPQVARVGPLPEAFQHNIPRTSYQQQQSDVIRLKCNECGDSFAARDELAQHLLYHNEVKTREASAPKIFRGVRKTGTSIAMPQSHTVLDSDVHNCVICGGLFEERKHMIQHVYAQHSRTGRYACMECNQIFTIAAELVAHSLTHSGTSLPDPVPVPERRRRPPKDTPKKQVQKEKSLEIICPQCHFGFTDNASFRIHWQNHGDANEITYPCSSANCKEVFFSLSLLNKHRFQFHPENKLLVCTQPGCDIPFTHLLGLKRHQRDAHNIVDNNGRS